MSKEYNFTDYIDRRKTSSTKWNILDNELPLWIADMDFQTCPSVSEAIISRAKHPIYGYTDISNDLFTAYSNFYKDIFNIEIDPSYMMFSLGVIPTISSTVRKLTNVGDNIVVCSPVYNIFYNSIVNNNRNVLEVPLIRKDDNYFLDFEGLEEAFKKENTTMIIFCNPANPVSRIWTKDELIRLGVLAKKYNVVVLSDEIHGFLTRPNTSYIPFFSVSEENKNNSVTCISVTKAFNLAGIHTSIAVCFNNDLYKKVNRQINTDEVAEPNVFSIVAAVAALNEGRDWLNKLREVLFTNRDYVDTYIKTNIPSIHLVNGDATYLLWIDISKMCTDSDEFISYLRKNTGLILSSGKTYGKGGNGYIRMNVACPKVILDDALNRLKSGVFNYIKDTGK